jgi:hypothetical protein
MKPKLKHIVLVHFKTEVLAGEIEDVFDKILDASENVPNIDDYVQGPNDSKESLNQGYTHGFVMTFADKYARDNYLMHPEHVNIKNLLQPMAENILVFDFEV